jgi:hypothetical protein
VKPFKSPERRKLDGLEGWLRERFIRHGGNADVVRQDLLAEKGVAVSRRTLQGAVQPYRQAPKAEALATTRFETPPVVATAIVDRLHHSHVLTIRGDSYRLRAKRAASSSRQPVTGLRSAPPPSVPSPAEPTFNRHP